ncbi:MAG: hypothetical protein WC860_06010 [Candidatus Margulisiibacteriota bacterium]|jgi:hypothetical protein
MEKCIITSASNKFFPSLINLIGSIKVNYPNHPDIYVYDLGLFYTFKKELESIEKVHIIKMPHFCSFWRSCYTWKTYIFNNPLAKLNFYIDAGSQILRPLDEIFDIIEKDNYFTVIQKVNLETITPPEYLNLFDIDTKYYKQYVIAAGIFGFKNEPNINKILSKLHEASISGLCLGFSPTEQWKNKGNNKNPFIRNCMGFRHDSTLLNLVLIKYLGNFKKHEIEKYGNDHSPNEHPEQLIWNFRMNYTKLQYLNKKYLNSKKVFISLFNLIILKLFLKLRIIRLILKGININNFSSK